MWEEVSLPRRQFSKGCQNSKRLYPLTEQFHFWKCSLDVGLHVLRAIDLKAKQNHMFKKKKRMAQESWEDMQKPRDCPICLPDSPSAIRPAQGLWELSCD